MPADLLLALALVCPPGSHPDTPGSQGTAAIRIGQPAPDLEFCHWVRVPSSPSSGASTDAGGRPSFELQKAHGRVVLVQSLASAQDDEFAQQGLPLLLDASRSYGEGDLSLVLLCSSEQAEAVGGLVEKAGLDAGVGAVDKERRYFAPSRAARASYVIGRSGEIVWEGDLAQDGKGFSMGLAEALRRGTFRPLGKPFAQSLEPLL